MNLDPSGEGPNSTDWSNRLMKLCRRRVGPVFKQVLRDDGVVGLWRGTVPTVVR